MSAAPGPIVRLRHYLDPLPPHCRLDLLKQVALLSAQGERSSELALVLEALRPSLEQDLRKDQGLQFARLVFFRPCERFVVDEHSQHKHRGFIARASLDGLWKWLGFRTEWTNWEARTERAVASFMAGHLAEADALVAGMRADAAGAIHEAREMASRSDLYRQKLSLRVGGPRAYADLADIAEIFERDVELEALGATIARIVGADAAPLDRAALQKILEILSVQAEEDQPGLALVRIFRQLPHPDDLLQILLTAEGTDDGARLAASRFAECVDVLTAELDLTGAAIDRLLGRHDQFDALCQHLLRFHRISRAISVGIDLDRAPAWRATLAERRRYVSASLAGEIEKAHDAILRALRPGRGADDPGPLPETIERAVYLARLIAVVRPLRAELAVNGVVMESFGRIQAYLSSLRKVARVEKASQAPSAERKRQETLHMLAGILAGPLGGDGAETAGD